MASIVEVTFIDGEVIEYEISANPSVARYLARKMGETGSLSLWNNDESYVIPAHSIRHYTVRRKFED
jgi:predicted chitinase